MDIRFARLTGPSQTLVDIFNRWENDPVLVPLTRPNKNKEELERQEAVTWDVLNKRLQQHPNYLIYMDDQLVGEMNYMVDPGHLYRKIPGTAWIGITIGEKEGQGKGIGYQAINYLEEQIKEKDLKRIEIGVFEFNEKAHSLYKKMGYKEIGRIPEFTFWQGKMWADIRMGKLL
ncbi:GNAT family N-acetyltransferase [Thalassobacillus pellis]|uniref:GNAT family N-acetyltransferase n=1 Tax=Thalassobacillus pellis TaxID=748008 RepID=UPI00195F789C|nr:GNAT family protein [Thalassobacillus pellis]MBM7553081.1 RimJ/RimL family protein N-acetyltransferase [Thalassobacillus pellis]